MIEMVAVIVLVAVIGIVAGGPTLAHVASVRTRSAAGRIVSDLRFAQRHAMSARLRTWVAFDASNESYRLYVENPSNPGKAGRVGLMHPLDQTTNAIQLGAAPFTGVGIASVAINSGSEVEFDSFGRPHDSAGAALSSTGTLTLTGGVVITLHPVSGFVERSP